ncbi:hypothetical protein AgCh_018548 [Apium graveolens]
MNVDAAIKEGQNSFSVGLVLRDDKGQYIAGKTRHFSGSVQVVEPETISILEGISFYVKLARVGRYSKLLIGYFQPFFDQDPSRNFDQDPSRSKGQPCKPVRTRIHNLEFDQDPSRTFDLDLGRIHPPFFIPGLESID